MTSSGETGTRPGRNLIVEAEMAITFCRIAAQSIPYGGAGKHLETAARAYDDITRNQQHVVLNAEQSGKLEALLVDLNSRLRDLGRPC